MSRSTRNLLMLFYLAVSITLLYIVSWVTLEYQKPSQVIHVTGSLDEPRPQSPPTKIAFLGGEFLKISQSHGITFTLSEARNLSHKETQCLAKNIYHEARGEGLAGMVGVAQVTLNRADRQYRGKSSICGVVHDSNQFSWTADNQKRQKKLNQSSWQQSLHVAQLVLLGIRIKELEESIYFHSHKNKSPPWSKDLPINKRIGSHTYLGSI